MLGETTLPKIKLAKDSSHMAVPKRLQRQGGPETGVKNNVDSAEPRHQSDLLRRFIVIAPKWQRLLLAAVD